LTGRPLAAFAAERLFGPLGMRVTRFRDDLTVPVHGIATGYTPAARGGWARVDITEETVGDGGVVTSIRDLAAWQHFILTGAPLAAGAGAPGGGRPAGRPRPRGARRGGAAAVRAGPGDHHGWRSCRPSAFGSHRGVRVGSCLPDRRRRGRCRAPHPRRPLSRRD